MHSYREILKGIFENRLKDNPSYSLRAYARDLQLAPSTSSEILSGKKGLSTERASRIAGSLKLPDWQRSRFMALISRERAGGHDG